MGLLSLLSACHSVERTERAVKIRIETYPSGAAVTAQSLEGLPVALGNAPVTLDRIAIVKKRFVNDELDYWLRDYSRKLPQNLAKPTFASPAFLAGNDYPYRITFTGTLEGSTATATVTFDRESLRRTFETGDGEIQVKLNVANSIAPAR
jgi:hypothetical protein